MNKISYEKFQTLLQQRNLKAVDVARGTGIYSGKLSDWKKGRYTPKLDKLQKIADYFGVPVTYFLDTNSLEKEAKSLGIDVEAEKARIYSLPKDKASQEIIEELGKLSEPQKQAILAVINGFLQSNSKA